MDPTFFGIKPNIIIKGGFPMFGAMGEAKNSISVIFSSKMALRRGLNE
jgi:urease alpha subunit